MIQIMLNGEKTALKESLTLAQMLKDLSFATPFYAVAVNRSVVPRSDHEKIHLKEGDEVEVVHAVGGG